MNSCPQLLITLLQRYNSNRNLENQWIHKRGTSHLNTFLFKRKTGNRFNILCSIHNKLYYSHIFSKSVFINKTKLRGLAAVSCTKTQLVTDAPSHQQLRRLAALSCTKTQLVTDAPSHQQLRRLAALSCTKTQLVTDAPSH